MPVEGPTRFKSRFSLLSLLPSRHPPLVVDSDPSFSSSLLLPVPDVPSVPSRYRLPPTQSVSERRPVLETPPRHPAAQRAHAAAADQVSLCLTASTPSSISPSDDRGHGTPQRGHHGPDGERIEEEMKSPPILAPLKAMSPFAAARQAGQARPTDEGSPGSMKEKKRPPPIDIGRVREMYPPANGSKPRRGPKPSLVKVDPPAYEKEGKEAPGTKGQLHAGTKLAEVVKAPTKKGRKAPPHPVKVKDDPFDFAVVDVGHKYTSWKGGKVDIRPGEIIPPHLLKPSAASTSGHAIRGQAIYPHDRETDALDAPGDSVLHDVLLTPTYLAASPRPPTSASLSPLSRGGKRRTLLDKAAYTLAAAARRSGILPVPRGILKHAAVHDDDKEMAWSLRRIRSKEALEMERFRLASAGKRTEGGGANGGSRKKPTFLEDHAWGLTTGVSPSPELDRSGLAARSPLRPGPGVEGGRKGGGWGRVVSGKRAEEEKGWKVRQEEEGRIKRKKRFMRYGLAVFLVIACALVIGLCTSLLTRPSSSSALSESSANSASNPTSTFVPPPVKTGTPSQALTSCLAAYGNSSSDWLSYPCSDCVPVLRQTENDFAFPLVNGNSTGVGAALQMCTLMSVYQATGDPTGLQKGGWGKGSVCAWNGVACDSRGRVSSLLLQFPNVPATLPDLGSLVALTSLAIKGNNTVPAGNFPATLLSTGALTSIDVEYTSLEGSLSSMDVSKSPVLQTLRLVNNLNLGNALPDLSKNSNLATLAVTGQGIKSMDETKLPSSLTYLDLSYNSLSGSVPSFSGLSGLSVLYLTNNAYTTAPASLPASLQTLELSANPALSGQMPSTVCSSTKLTSCDLRNTNLSGSVPVAAATTTMVAPSAVNKAVGPSNGTTTSSSSAMPMKQTSAVLRRAESCGSCLFT